MRRKVEVEGKNSATPLKATYHYSLKCFELLLKAGANPMNKWGSAQSTSEVIKSMGEIKGGEFFDKVCELLEKFHINVPQEQEDVEGGDTSLATEASEVQLMATDRLVIVGEVNAYSV